MNLKHDRRERLGAAIRLANLPTLATIPRAQVIEALRREARAPLRGGDRGLQHDGLFGDGYRQRELF